jgi:nuclear mRNA export protein PCID2/THP1
VTYLYYLGRFQFSNNHFYHAQSCLQAAYDQCHARCTNQRRLILIYLLATNLILGRFPSKAFMSRPESAGVLEKFIPISKAIRRGDMAAFKCALGPESGNEKWFFQKGLLLPILSRAEVLVWRSLARRVFLITYQLPSDPNSRKAPTLDLQHLVTAAQYCQKILEGWSRPSPLINPLSGTFPDLIPPPDGPKHLMPNQGTVFGNLQPDLLEIEAIIASLVQQGLLHGFVSHNLARFAILGAKQRGGALAAGFPAPWAVIKERTENSGEGGDVPGWVVEDRRGGVGSLGGVVNLTGVARPVGSGL